MYQRTPLLPYEGPGLHTFQFPEDVAAFSVGDVHGHLPSFVELLDRMSDVPTPGRQRLLILNGDLNDRGPNTLGVYAHASQAAALYGFDATIRLPGNHELMMMDCLRHLLAHGNLRHEHARNWLENGGMTALAEANTADDLANAKTPEDWAALAQNFLNALADIDGQPWMDAMDQAPSHVRLGDAVFVHAGVLPKAPLDNLRMRHDQHLSLRDSDHHWAWIRQPFLGWQGGFYQDGWATRHDPNSRGLLVVHGHTAPGTLSSTWMDSPAALERGVSRMRTNARINLDANAGHTGMTAGAILTSDGWTAWLANGA